MATTWALVTLDTALEEQAQPSADDRGYVTTTLVQTWTVATDGTSKSDAMEARGAAVAGGYAVPQVNAVIETVGGDAFRVNQVLARRTGPYSFAVQVSAKQSPLIPEGQDKFFATVRIGGEPYVQDAYEDKDDNAIVNSANQPFDPSIPKKYSDERIEVQYTTKTDQSASFVGVRNTVNEGEVTFNIRGVSRTFAARCLLCDSVDQTVQVGYGSTPLLYQVSAVFIGRDDGVGFVNKVVDQGLYTLATDGSNGLVPIKDAHGQNVTQPVWLDGTGQRNTTTTPHYLTFKIEDEADFTSVFTGLS